MIYLFRLLPHTKVVKIVLYGSLEIPALCPFAEGLFVLRKNIKKKSIYIK
jgi:hypothetical protein